METKVKTRKRRLKQDIPAMLPVKQWLSVREACAYMDMSINHLSDLMTQNGLSVSVINRQKYYKLSELQKFIESNIIIRQTA